MTGLDRASKVTPPLRRKTDGVATVNLPPGASGASQSAGSEADDKSQPGGLDEQQVASNEPYDASYLARRYGISRDLARNVIAKLGNSRVERLVATDEPADGIETRRAKVHCKVALLSVERGHCPVRLHIAALRLF